ncbi:hypothetical protein BWX39_09910 [Prevotella intermedia ATCC 25611 = DSM 20706]|uniref:hypothetical protein n=1 Tax=Prevotella intermedia TaxID=28131 RepID=UPI00049142AD|nr:hypothetical protein [Prevotella intermedia]APW33011.1 hypothetical protein BWX39_09910 [Prevotella intermedia ATCC 25611 = DSM 20706]SUB98444.1 Uncharacterised protein [Prevotella intermedia]DAS12050.1 MAG TPA: protein of unknown function (DUF4969) [Caudoviricetes sp.]
MNTKKLFSICAFGVCLTFGGCSTNDELDDIQTMPETQVTVTEKQTSEFTYSLVTAIEQAVSNPVYFIYDCATKESLICNEEQFILGQSLYKVLNAGNDNIVKDNNEKTKIEMENEGWTFAGNINGKLQALKLASKLSTQLPADKTVEIRIVPRKDGSKDVYYRIEG